MHAPLSPGGALRHRLTVGFVIFHALAVLLLSVPSPVGARQPSTWKDAHVREQVLGVLRPFRGLLGGRDDEALMSLTRDVAVRLMSARDVVIAPFQPYARLVGANQGWQMFGSINSRPARLRVRVASSEGGPWTDIYLARDDELAWRRELMDEERVRALVNNWSWGREKAGYLLFARRWAQLVAEDYPDARRVEFAMLRYTVPEPDELGRGRPARTKTEWVEVVELGPPGSAP